MTESEQREVFNAWLAAHKGIIFKIVRAYAFTPHDQDDLFQEIALRVWQSIPDFRGESKVSTWIYRVALFTATSWVRREQARPPTQPLEAVAHALTQTPQPRDERLDWLYRRIADLDPIDRSVCLLMLDGYSYREMAALLGISESHVGVKIHRIKNHLLRKAREVNWHGV